MTDARPCCIIAGHSHLVAFGIPEGTPGIPFGMRDLAHSSGRFRILSGDWPRSKEYWQAARTAAAGHIIALFWRGNQHLSQFLLEPDQRFDFVLSSEPDLPLDETATILPEALLREPYARSLFGLNRELRLLRKGGARPIVCGTPPPRGDDDGIRTLLQGKENDLLVRLKELAGGDVSSIRLSPPLLRYKLWALIQSMLRDIAISHGVPFLPAPSAAQTEDGFLRDAYKFDVTHANTAYGDLVLDEIWQGFMQESIATASR